MSKRAKLLVAIRKNPTGVRFDGLVKLILALGFKLERQVGSHAIYTHPRSAVPIINVQNMRGRAKPYQVRQVLAIADEFGLEVK